MTIAEMSTRLSQRLADPNGDIWTAANHRVPMLNDAQQDLVLRLLSFGEEYSHIFDLLAGLQTLETGISIPTTGYALSGLSGKTYLENGYVNSSAVLNNLTKWFVKITADKLGITQNSFMTGTNRSPKCYIWEEKYYVLVSLGSYPVTISLYYIGAPTEMETSTPTNSDLNIILHNLVVDIAAVKCLSMRMDAKDVIRIQQLQTEIDEDILMAVRGSLKSPKSKSTGQHLRESKEVQAKTLEIQSQNVGVQNGNTRS